MEEKLWQSLYKLCDETKTRRTGVEYLIKYYQSLGWTEEKAIQYAIDLFQNGTVRQIKLLNEEGKEI